MKIIKLVEAIDQEEEIYCSKCGAKLSKDFNGKFCPRCRQKEKLEAENEYMKEMTESKNCDIEYSEKEANKFRNNFDIASPKETANEFRKNVKYKGKIIKPDMKESCNKDLNESVSSDLQDKVLDILDWFIESDIYPINPSEWYGENSWKDVKELVEMGLDNGYETAEGLKEYLENEISLILSLGDKVDDEDIIVDDPETEILIDLYNSLIRSMKKYEEKYA